MDLSRYVTDLQHRVDTAADAVGDDARALAQQLTAPLDAAVRLTLLNALSDAAGEISADLAPGSVDLRLRSGEPEFVVSPAEPAAPSAPATPTTAPAPAHSPADVRDAETGATSRTTLRIPDHLKSQVEAAATRDGVSVNTWLVRAVGAALDRPAPEPHTPDHRGGTRLTGWVR